MFEESTPRQPATRYSVRATLYVDPWRNSLQFCQ